MKRILIAGAAVLICMTVMRADDWPFSSPKPINGPATVDGMPIIRDAGDGHFKEGEVDAAIASVKPSDYYQREVPKLDLQEFQTQGATLVGQVIKLKYSSREQALNEVKDGSDLPVVQLREDVYSQRQDSFSFVYQDVKIPPGGEDFVKHIDVSRAINYGQKPHVFTAYVLVLKGGKPVFLGREVTEPGPTEQSKFAW